MTRTKYQQLQPEERLRIEIWKAEDVSLRAMARMLGRAPSTLMRELRRNATARGGYGAMRAQACRTQRLKASRPVAKLAPDGVLWGVVLQPDVMPHLCQLPGPVVSTAACFHPDQARRAVREVLQELRAPDRAVHDLSSFCVYVVHLKHILCNVDSHWHKLHDRPSGRVLNIFMILHFGHFDAAA